MNKELHPNAAAIVEHLNQALKLNEEAQVLSMCGANSIAAATNRLARDVIRALVKQPPKKDRSAALHS